MKTVGLISDTHGLLRLTALEALQGSDMIVHAGDIGDSGVIEALGRIAPVYAVRGNVDRGREAEYPAREIVIVERLLLYVLHDIAELDLDPSAAGFQAVIYGHSHRASVVRKDGVLYVNPGSAGPRRFHLPATVVKMQVGPEGLSAEIVPLHE